MLLPEGLPLLPLYFCPARGVEEPLDARSVHASSLLSLRSIRGLGKQELLSCGGLLLPDLSRLVLPPHLCTPCEVMGWENLQGLSLFLLASPASSLHALRGGEAGKSSEFRSVRIPPWLPDLRLGKPGRCFEPALGDGSCDRSCCSHCRSAFRARLAVVTLWAWIVSFAVFPCAVAGGLWTACGFIAFALVVAGVRLCSFVLDGGSAPSGAASMASSGVCASLSLLSLVRPAGSHDRACLLLDLVVHCSSACGAEFRVLATWGPMLVPCSLCSPATEILSFFLGFFRGGSKQISSSHNWSLLNWRHLGVFWPASAGVRFLSGLRAGDCGLPLLRMVHARAWVVTCLPLLREWRAAATLVPLMPCASTGISFRSILASSRLSFA